MGRAYIAVPPPSTGMAVPEMYDAAYPRAAALAMAERYAQLDPQLTRDIKSAVGLAAGGDFDATLDFESWAQAAAAAKPEIQATVARFRK